jgi:hypothetical protein
MGLNVQAANFMLPTTRLWNMFLKGKLKKREITYTTVNLTNQSPMEPRKMGFYRQIIKFMRKTGGLGNRILEEWYRQFIAYYYEKRGYIVIFDRHFIYDFYEDNTDSRRSTKPVKAEIHDFIRRKTMSQPDLVICLDAPGEVVFKRKKEFNIEYLECKRNQYLGLQKVVKNFVIIDANRSLESVVHDVSDRIIQFRDMMVAT